MKTVAAPRGLTKIKREGENSVREKNGSPKEVEKKNKEPLQNHLYLTPLRGLFYLLVIS